MTDSDGGTQNARAPEPTVEIVDVSPGLAESWLARNPNNRNLRKAVLDAYARDIAGRWTLASETVTFDVHGHMRDGQHRLNEAELPNRLAVPYTRSVIAGPVPPASSFTFSTANFAVQPVPWFV